MTRTPPHDLEAEQAILGSCLQKTIAVSESLNVVTAEDFYSQAHVALFNVIEGLFRENSPVDVVTVMNMAKERGKLDEIGGPSYIAQLMQIPPSTSRVASYCGIVADKAKSRKLITVSQEIIGDCYAGASTKDTIDNLGSKFFEIAVDRKNSAESIGSIGKSVVAKIEERSKNRTRVTGIPSGYYDIDTKLAGFQDSQLIIIAGRPSMGKTTFAMNIINHAATEGFPVLFFSLEMDKKQIGRKHLSLLARVDDDRLKRGTLDDSDWLKIIHAQEIMEKQPLYIDDAAALSVMQIRARSRLMAAKYGIKMVVVDYLGLCSVKGESREREIGEVSAGLKALAKELGIPVIALAQLNRKCEERTDKRPLMSDLRDSGSIEQDADVIMFVYRDEMYNKSEDNPLRGIAEILIRKNRDGATGDARLNFMGALNKFENLANWS